MQRPEVKQAIDRLRRSQSIFAKYPTTEDLIDLGRPGRRDYEDKDAILTALLSEMKRETTLFPLLNLMFWKSLACLYYRKRRKVPWWQHDELMARVQFDFFRTAIAYPLERRPQKIDANLIFDTMKKVTRWQGEEVLYDQQHEEFVPAHEGRPSFVELQVSEIFPEEMETYLLDLLYRGVINDRQYDLLLETDVYKRMTQKVWAATRGFAYATVRSWHFRAEAAIRKYEQARREREQETE